MAKFRPQIPDFLVQELEQEVEGFDHTNEDRDMYLYEIGGYNSKGEFVREAVREKLNKHKEEYL